MDENPAMKMPMAAAITLVLRKCVLSGVVKCPSRIHPAGEHHVQFNAASNDEQVPAYEVDFREGYVFRPNHERYEKVAQHSRRYWHQKEKHHDDAVHGEQLVVDVRGHKIAGGGE